MLWPAQGSLSRIQGPQESPATTSASNRSPDIPLGVPAHNIVHRVGQCLVYPNTMTTAYREPPALCQLDVINIGLALNAIEVRLPNGARCYLTVPESEQGKLRHALREAVDGPAKEPPVGFLGPDFKGSSCVWCQKQGHLGIECDQRGKPLQGSHGAVWPWVR